MKDLQATLKLSNDISLIEPICSFAYDWSILNGLDKYKSQEFILALDELITDVIIYAVKKFQSKNAFKIHLGGGCS